MAKKKQLTDDATMEDVLWKAAVKLRGGVEYPIYKNIVLPLVFLKFISDKFNKQRQKLIEDPETKDFIEFKEFYNQDSICYLEPECRWEYILANAKADDIRLIIDRAMEKIESDNEELLKGTLPKNYYAGVEIEDAKLSSLIDVINKLNTMKDEEEDIIGRVYEYFIGMFSSKEGKGEFYTPKPIVKLIAEMIQPLHGHIFDPCCGSGGMFVQSMKIVEAHKGHRDDVALIGQEYSPTTLRLAKMNMAIRGISADFGSGPTSSLTSDQHKDLRADFVMANPPFNQDDWGLDQVKNDPRWVYGTPPNSNANYAWIQHFLYHLNENGIAGFVLANGALTTTQNGEDEIRKNMVEKSIIDCIISMPDKLFYKVTIPVSLWFCSKSKKRRTNDTKNRILFIRCNELGRMTDRTHKTIDDDEILRIADTYHKWVNDDGYEDVLGFCKSATISEIRENGYKLNPGLYTGYIPKSEGGVSFEEKMKNSTEELRNLLKESHSVEDELRKALKSLGYEI